LLYIDSNVFLYPVVYDLGAVVEARRCKDLLLRIVQGDVEACTATVTWDEVAWVVRKLFGLELSVDEARKFLGFPNMRFFAVKKTTLFKAQELMEKYKIKPRDAIHAATALENRVTNILSYDRDFDEINELKRIEP